VLSFDWSVGFGLRPTLLYIYDWAMGFGEGPRRLVVGGAVCELAQLPGLLECLLWLLNLLIKSRDVNGSSYLLGFLEISIMQGIPHFNPAQPVSLPVVHSFAMAPWSI